MIKSLIYNSDSGLLPNVSRPLRGEAGASSTYKAAKVKQPPDFLRNPVAIIVRWEITGKKVVVTKSVTTTRHGTSGDNGFTQITIMVLPAPNTHFHKILSGFRSQKQNMACFSNSANEKATRTGGLFRRTN